MQPNDFIAMIATDARRLQKKAGIFASVVLAQACLETGYGASHPVDKYTKQESYNLFGIKGEGTAGHVISTTWEVVGGKRIVIDANFRAYNNFLESLEDHNKVLMLNRYTPVRNAIDGAAAAMQLHPCGYATDPDYGKKLVSIQKKFNLYQYDTPMESLYAVYQGKKHLSDFYDFNSAVIEAQKWANSYVSKISNGDWVWTNIKKDEPVKEVPKLDATTIEQAKNAIDQLAAAGLISSPDYWKGKVEEELPVWAYMIIEARKLNMK